MIGTERRCWGFMGVAAYLLGQGSEIEAARIEWTSRTPPIAVASPVAGSRALWPRLSLSALD